jgi:hypothetical protein
MEERKQLHAGGQLGEEAVEAQERAVGLRRPGQRLQQGRHQLGQQLARAGAAHRAVMSVMPAAHRSGDFPRILEAELAQRLQRRRVVLGSREHQIARAAQGRRFFEEVRIVLLDARQMAEELRRERGRIGITEERCQCCELRAFLGQGMGLLIGDHLQAVLDAAQEVVGREHVLGSLLSHTSGARQRLDGRPGRGRAQLGEASAPDELLRLGEELDLADSAAPELHVVAAERHGRPAAMRVDLPLDRVDVLDRGEVEVLAPHIRPERGEERGTRGKVARDGARLDHGGALPVLPQALVIGLGGEHRQRQRRGGGVGAQPQIGAEDVPLGLALLQEAHEVARQADEDLLQRVGCRTLHALGVVEDDEIDVARVVQLARTQLAERQHEVAGLDLGFGGMRQADRPGGRRPAQQVAHGERDRGLRHGTQRSGDALQGPQAGDVGEADRQRGAPLGDPQARHELGLLDLAAQLVRQPLEKLVGYIRAAAQQVDRELRILDHAVREVGAVAEDRLEHVPSGR